MSNKKIPQPEKLGEKLRQIREHLNLSQNEILRRLGFEKQLFRSNVSQYELGRREPPLQVLLAYARLIDTSVDVLIDDKASLDL